METSLPRLRGLAVSPRTFRRIATANVVMLIVVVATGATVRLTASGLGCEHWPGCQPGAPLPEKGFHSYIEFSNRLVAGLTVLTTLVTLVAALLTRGLRRWARWIAAATFLGTFGQAPLGAVTVYYDLNPYLVLSHFLLSLVVITFAVVLLLEAWNVRGERVASAVRGVALLVGVAACAMVVSGTLATAGGPHPGSNEDVRRLDTFGTAVYWHVRATAVFGIALALLLVWLARRRSAYLRFGLPVVGVLAVQMAVGEIQYRTELPWWLVLVHVTLAATLWAAIAAFVAALWRPSRIP
jgi:cytochrome c oxidase assembly protein subunit 15